MRMHNKKFKIHLYETVIRKAMASPGKGHFFHTGEVVAILVNSVTLEHYKKDVKLIIIICKTIAMHSNFTSGTYLVQG